MKINVKGMQMEIAPETMDYLDKRLSAVDKFVDPNDGSAIALVEIGRNSEHHKTGEVYRAEIKVHVAGKEFFTFSENIDLNSAIDVAKDEMLQEMRSWKGKRTSLIRRSGRSIKNAIRGLDPRGWRK